MKPSTVTYVTRARWEAMGDDTKRVLTEYVTWMRACRHSRATIRARESFAKARLYAWGPSGFTYDQMLEYFGSEEMEDCTDWTRATYFGHMKELTAWLKATRRIPVDPMLSLKKGSTPSSSPRPLTDGDVVRVLAAAEGELRDWLVIALRSGLRVSEIAKLRGEDVTPEGLYVQGKGGKRTTLPCDPEIWAMAQRYPRNGFWFPGGDRGHIRSTGISNKVGKLFQSLGIEGSIHRCRHSYATSLLRNGVHIRNVQKLMRHASVATTAAYTAVDEDELRAALGMLPPLPPPGPTAA